MVGNVKIGGKVVGLIFYLPLYPYSSFKKHFEVLFLIVIAYQNPPIQK